MTSRTNKRSIPSQGDIYGNDRIVEKEEEKTIPFLRRLVDMLSENDLVISFYPGCTKKGTLGRIVVHDRLKVEAEVLPRYFNHSSFASLRRQLNYFSFTRMGKGRQRGATYCNEAVVELEDILRLKRRSTVGPQSRDSSSSIQPLQEQPTATPTATGTGKLQRSVSVSSSSVDNSNDGDAFHHKRQQRPAKKSRQSSVHANPSVKLSSPTLISPRTSPVHQISPEEGPRITLDLTVPSSNIDPTGTQTWASGIYAPNLNTVLEYGDADVLAGCRALLSFSRGFQGEIGSAV